MANILAKINYDVRRGDTTSFEHRLTIGTTQADALPVDLTGWELAGQVKYNPDDVSSWVDLTTYLTIHDPTDGRWRIAFTATQAATLIPIGSTDSTSAEYDIQLRKIGFEETTTQTLQTGRFNVLSDITRVIGL